MAVSRWLIIELSEAADLVSYPELEVAMQSVFGCDTEFFIPKYHETMGSYVSTNTLFEGYAFVKDTDESRDKIQNIRDNRYFVGALKVLGKIRTVDSYEIGVLRKKLKNSVKKDIQPGTKVKILKGIFENLMGEVVSTEDGGKVTNVRVSCLSRVILAPIPTTCVEEIKN